MSYLFLDFDGVLHPEPCSAEQCFCRLGLFEGWLRGRPGLDVVISSSWREVHAIDKLRSFFSEDLRPRIVGATPMLAHESWAEYDGEMPPTRFKREFEVTQWLHASGESWRIWTALDDQAWLYRPFNPRLVLCDAKTGLTQDALDRLDALLGPAA